MIGHGKGWFLRHKKQCIIVAILGIAILAGMYVFASIKNWESYEQQNAHYMTDAQQKVDQALAKVGQDNLKSDEKMRQFDHLSAFLKEGDRRCESNFLFSWQQALPINGARIETCQNQSKRLSSLRSSLDIVTAHLKNEQELTALIVTASGAKANPGEAEWPIILEQWAVAEDQLRTKKVTKTFESTKAMGIGKMQAVRSAWQALIDANKAKDRAEYEAAAASLAQSYGALVEITQAAEVSLTPLVANFNQAYKEAFKKP